MTPHDVNSLIDLPYEAGAFGPDSFNCWGLLYYVQRHYFKTNMPIAPIGDSQACKELFDKKIYSGDWAKVERPEHGCGALMRGGEEPHVGIYLDLDAGGILHAMEGAGVIWTPIRRLRALNFGRTTYYRLHK